MATLPYPFIPGYFVSDSGYVLSHRLGGRHAGIYPHLERRLIARLDRYGYEAVTLRGDGGPVRKHIHALVLETFVRPRRPGEQCRHLDGQKRNNTLENLAWGTQAENSDDRERHGRNFRGTRHMMAKLTEADVLEIRASTSLTNKQLAERFGVSNTLIFNVRHRRTWRHVA